MGNYHLRVYADHSEVVEENLPTTSFYEGEQSTEALRRYKRIRDVLSKGYLESRIARCGSDDQTLNIRQEDMERLNYLVDSINPNLGKALLGLTILQLVVKAVCPEQDIRLHKSSKGHSAFSWKEGISMRSLDKSFITPVLRKYNLLRLNADGFMMTRSLAENYPYTKVYKAQIRGKKDIWLQIIDDVENGKLPSEAALDFLLSTLLNRSKTFQELSLKVEKMGESVIHTGFFDNRARTLHFFREVVNTSGHAARVMEIAMHTLMQALDATCDGIFFTTLVPLSQMRSANKKHGNVGDIELSEDGELISSWDAKYGKDYLRDELDELEEKLEKHPHIRHAGFVTFDETDANVPEIKNRIDEIKEATHVNIFIISFNEWANDWLDKVNEARLNEHLVLRKWVMCYIGTIGQTRRDIAPVDEPCYKWLEVTLALLKSIKRG